MWLLAFSDFVFLSLSSYAIVLRIMCEGWGFYTAGWNILDLFALFCSLLKARLYCLLLTTYYLILTAHYLLLPAPCSLLKARLTTPYYLILTTYCHTYTTYHTLTRCVSAGGSACCSPRPRCESSCCYRA
jgi:hypothetical protein